MNNTPKTQAIEMTPEAFQALQAVRDYAHAQLAKRKRLTTEKYSLLIHLSIIEKILLAQ